MEREESSVSWCSGSWLALGEGKSPAGEIDWLLCIKETVQGRLKQREGSTVHPHHPKVYLFVFTESSNLLLSNAV